MGGGYIPGAWDEVRDATRDGHISDEAYATLHEAMNTLKNIAEFVQTGRVPVFSRPEPPEVVLPEDHPGELYELLYEHAVSGCDDPDCDPQLPLEKVNVMFVKHLVNLIMDWHREQLTEAMKDELGVKLD